MNDLRIASIDGVSTIKEAAWDELVGDDSPFLEHAFLGALEETGCVGPGTGWRPHILCAYRSVEGEEELVGALPSYEKRHSAGEFVFDWGWADAAHRSGIDYYPKAVVQVPFTPVMGRRILVHPEADDPQAVRERLVGAAVDWCERDGLSSVHFNFVLPEELEALEAHDLPIRKSYQYHWPNGGPDGSELFYDDFEEFLGRLRSKKRSNIKRQRRGFRERGGSTRLVAGDEVTDDDLRRMYGYYRDTVNKYFGGSLYLNEEFYLELGRRMPEKLHIVFAQQNGETFGGAFNIFKGDRLYGRYWGATRDVKHAHFETCFYRSIEWCIDHDMAVFEGGSGGEHKFDRGFMPRLTYSAHYIRHPALKQAIREFCAREGRAVEERAEQLREDSPYKERHQS